MRRFDSPNKGFAKQRPGLANCGWNEPWERSDLGEWNPEPPTGGEAHTDLLRLSKNPFHAKFTLISCHKTTITHPFRDVFFLQNDFFSNLVRRSKNLLPVFIFLLSHITLSLLPLKYLDYLFL
jgi:hypothetical protein